MHDYHLTPDGDRWKLTSGNSDRTLCDFPEKQEAVEICTEFVHDLSASLKVHLPDGTIEEERSFPSPASALDTAA